MAGQIEAVTFTEAVRRVQKAMYVYNMTVRNMKLSEASREKHMNNLIDACKFLGSWNDPE